MRTDIFANVSRYLASQSPSSVTNVADPTFSVKNGTGTKRKAKERRAERGNERVVPLKLERRGREGDGLLIELVRDAGACGQG